MPELSKPKHEQFAQALAAGENSTKAYCRILKRKENEGARVSACRLKAKVAPRVLEITGGVAPIPKSTAEGDLVVQTAKRIAKTRPPKRKGVEPLSTDDIQEKVETVIQDASQRIQKVAVEAIEQIGTFLTVAERRSILAQIVRTPLSEIGPDSILCQEYRKRTVLGNENQDDYEIETVKKPDIIKALVTDAQMSGEMPNGDTHLNINAGQAAIQVNIPAIMASPRVPPRRIKIDEHQK